jgi:UDP-N-acetylglucosamine 2-epimerase (non-hydrolysing)
VVVVGDVNSTVAAALAASTLGLPVAHVEAGLRSADWTMPEERNRVLTDRVSAFLFTPSEDAGANLRAEGLDESRIHFVGNVMIDSLDWMLPRLSVGDVLRKHGVEGTSYALVTLHRPSNVDRPDVLRGLLSAFGRIAREVPVLFPVHPRTRQRLQELNGTAPVDAGLAVLPPLDYTEFIALLSSARLVLTDSGGIQEEATVLGTPCLTLRDNTERPITVHAGSNQVIGSDPDRVADSAGRVLSSPRPPAVRPPLWDGRSADRIVRVLEDGLG